MSMARSKSVRRRTAPSSSVGSTEGSEPVVDGVADATILDGDVDMVDDSVNVAPITISSDSLTPPDGIDIDANDNSLFDGLEGDEDGAAASDAVGGDVKDDPVDTAAAVDSAVGTDSSGTDTSFQSTSTESTDARDDGGEPVTSSTASTKPTLYESVSLISEAVGRAVKGGGDTGAVVDPIIVSIDNLNERMGLVFSFLFRCERGLTMPGRYWGWIL